MFSLQGSKNVIFLFLLVCTFVHLQEHVISGQSHHPNLITSPASHDSLTHEAVPAAVSPEADSTIGELSPSLLSSPPEMHAPINLTEDSLVHDAVVTSSPEELTHTELSTVSPSVAEDPVTLSASSAAPTTTAPIVHYFADVELPCDENEEHSVCPEHSHCVGTSCKCLEEYCSANATTTCLVTSNSEVVCLCEPGFSGDRCEHDGNSIIVPAAAESSETSCDAVHCLNNGTCAIAVADGMLQAHCNCLEGFEGMFNTFFV